MLIKQPFDEFLKFHYERIDETHMKVTLPIQPLFINSAGLVHGGIISTLADVAMGNIFKPDENHMQTVVTADLKVSFLRGANGEYLIADAHLVKRGLIAWSTTTKISLLPKHPGYSHPSKTYPIFLEIHDYPIVRRV